MRIRLAFECLDLRKIRTLDSKGVLKKTLKMIRRRSGEDPEKIGRSLKDCLMSNSQRQSWFSLSLSLCLNFLCSKLWNCTQPLWFLHFQKANRFLVVRNCSLRWIPQCRPETEPVKLWKLSFDAHIWLQTCWCTRHFSGCAFQFALSIVHALHKERENLGNICQ